MRFIIQGIFLVLVLLSTQTAYSSNQRLISLSPATTEILFSLGLQDKIIGNTTFCNFPQEAKNIPKVGTFSEPNIERIISLKPDIVFTTGLEQAQTVLKLRKLGIKVFINDPKSFSELFESIIKIGEITDKEQEAKSLVKEMKERMEIVQTKVAKIPKRNWPKVFIEIWYAPIMTAGPSSIVGELIDIAGGKNIAYDTPRPYSRFSAEVVIDRNPDIIILGYMTKENTQDLVSNRLGWKNIDAVKNNRVVCDISPDLMFRPGPRIIIGLEKIYKHLYSRE